ncbi:RNA cytidine acetyltransferase 1 [Sesamum angolense]|uniref:RNA cytidine acetyltransferase n=1 Tax=Sesamum angolense TaxID=2727404 RepID=A0AAE1WED0_9LAMI|nr:RNA cytidine acetyltransferase 1 [Sesamum angolense]
MVDGFLPSLKSDESEELSLLKEQLFEVFPVGPLVGMCTSLDQGKAVSTFLDAILDKTLQSTIAVTASRGRGKSAALGLAVAGAVAAGPTPTNLSPLFEFLCKGLHMLKYEEHLHYDVVRSGNPIFRKAIIRINIHKQHRQTIQYIEPRDHMKLSQVELLVIDEAAAIPLPIVKHLIGPYLVFLSSTVNGYEGTGRSLSLKLLSHLEKKSQMQPSGANDSNSAKSFQKLELKEPIRYASEDPVESWLNDLLCLDATNSPPTISRLPHPSECQLYYVTRDTLFSFHKESEIFLQRMMSLLVSSHYKNSPNDLQLMADAPAHHLFVLLGPVDESQNILPDLFCVIQKLTITVQLGNQIFVIQVCLEGEISREAVFQSLRNGHQPAGDQIPWKFCEEFENTDFPMLSGARIHGYGSAALDLLTRYYKGQLDLITEEDKETKDKQKLPGNVTQAAAKVSLLEETITPRQDLPPLLIHLRHRTPEKIHYIGASFGLTLDLYHFWKKHRFQGKFARSLPLCFREMDYKLAMRLLEAYTSGLKDYGKVRNLVPLLAQLYFQEKLPISLSYLEASILLSMGLQLHDITYIEGKMKIDKQQLLFLFRKTMVKFSKYLCGVVRKELAKSLPKEEEAKRMLPHSISLEDDLHDGAKQVLETMKQDGIKLLDPRSESLEQYTVADKDLEFEHALRSCSTVSGSGLLSVKSKRALVVRVVKSKKDGGRLIRGRLKDGDLLVNRDGVRIVSQSEVEAPALIQPSDNQLSLADFDAVQVIGKGNGGIVRLVQHKWTGQFFALKVLAIAVYDLSSSVSNVYPSLRIIHLKAVRYYPFSPSGAFGLFHDFLKKVNKIPEPYLAAICKQGLETSNLLINHRGEVKITDFGVSAILASTSGLANTFIGTYNYMSPERIIGGNYGYKSDIWSLGLVLLECAAGQFPYSAPQPEGWINVYELMETIVDQPAPRAPSDLFSPEFCSFISACVQKDPKDRLSANELMAHPFITKYDDLDVDLALYFTSAGLHWHFNQGIWKAIGAASGVSNCASEVVDGVAVLENSTIMLLARKELVFQRDGVSGTYASTEMCNQFYIIARLPLTTAGVQHCQETFSVWQSINECSTEQEPTIPQLSFVIPVPPSWE